jgi:hypothetical protein
MKVQTHLLGFVLISNACSVECSGGVCKVVHTNYTAKESTQQTKDPFNPVVALVGEEIEDASGNVHKTRDITKGISPSTLPTPYLHFIIKVKSLAWYVILCISCLFTFIYSCLRGLMLSLVLFCYMVSPLQGLFTCACSVSPISL